jgi:hypothetical protein
LENLTAGGIRKRPEDGGLTHRKFYFS